MENMNDYHPETSGNIPRRRVSWFAILSVAVLSFTAGLIVTYALFELERTVVVDGIDDVVDEDDLADLLLVLNELENDHYFFNEDNDLIRGAIEGMIAATGDGYTNFFSLSDFEGAMSHLRETFYGIGAEVTTINGDTTIVAPMPGSPAEHYGVLSGDVVISVDGEDVRDEFLGDVISKIRGEYGTVVTLGILRAGSDFIYIDVTRGEIVNETVTTDILESDDGKVIGYLRVSTFGEATLRDFRYAIEELEKEEIDGLIVDVRNNSGGYLSAVTGMVSYMLPSDLLITSAVDRDGREIPHYTSGNASQRLDVDIVTLINGGSASASEIFAAAMIESGGFEVVGTTSFGKGTVQQSRPIRDDGMLQMTIQVWKTPDGHLIEGYGVEPTVEVEASDFVGILQVSLGDEDVLTYDMVHPGIESSQQILDAIGYDVDRTDGFFDSSTEGALEEFQANNDLEVTGEIDGATASALSMALRDIVRDPGYDTQIQAALALFND